MSTVDLSSMAYDALLHADGLRHERNPDVLAAALSNRWNVIRHAAAKHPINPLSLVLEHAPDSTSPDSDEFWAAVASRSDLTDSTWEQVLSRGAWKTQEQIARNTTAPARVLSRLDLTTADQQTLLLVIAHRHTPIDTIYEALDLCLVGTQRRMPGYFFDRLVFPLLRRDLTDTERSQILHTILALAADPADWRRQQDVLCGLVGSLMAIPDGQVPAGTITDIWAVSQPFVENWVSRASNVGLANQIAMMLKRDDCPAEVLAEACMSRNAPMRRAAAGNPHCPDEGRVAAALHEN